MKEKRQWIFIILFCYSFLTVNIYADNSVDRESAQLYLQKAREELYQEWARFQILGRAHSLAEIERINKLNLAMEKINEVIKLLDSDEKVKSRSVDGIFKPPSTSIGVTTD